MSFDWRQVSIPTPSPDRRHQTGQVIIRTTDGMDPTTTIGIVKWCMERVVRTVEFVGRVWSAVLVATHSMAHVERSRFLTPQTRRLRVEEQIDDKFVEIAAAAQGTVAALPHTVTLAAKVPLKLAPLGAEAGVEELLGHL
ncbi:hypothetical protein COCMIDRAFT_31058 [Bipolaris oryzae ATCC 44560]|uniref:Uncharacterized protein n=1 Tax=Bipolaris oryzae ATCC 44560 TaxID=930090 RepID=W6YQF7_COCMI|nr:uncharacterized protein COCMIDRAFT_31058 [Bipolaris oryzae ATCC 44560]EUC39890.1 hypothetical protein COCMIDRAFT_31058 [Bipolaris oryzae ATCC 44560]